MPFNLLENNLLYISKNNDRKNQLIDILSQVTTDNFIPIGDELIFGKLFEDIGCNQIFKTINSKLRKIDEKIFLEGLKIKVVSQKFAIIRIRNKWVHI